MFVPASYRTDSWAVGHLVRGYPLALLVTNGEPAPNATHLPVIPETGEPGTPGSTLLGHLNRANPHWRALSDGMAARLVFTGPHGYISPVVYQSTPAAPTWNYTAAHLLGSLEVLDGLEQTLRTVRATVARFEEAFGAGWDPEPSLPYFAKIGPAVGVFRMTVTEAYGQYKLSQDKDRAARQRVIEWFASGTGTQRDLAEFMRGCGLGVGEPA